MPSPKTGLQSLALCLAVTLCASAPANSEIEKIATPSDAGLHMTWWPKLPELGGWHHESEASIENAANILAPDGFTFSDAEAVIYAKAVYKPSVTNVINLDQMIENDVAQFTSGGDIVATEVGALTTGDGDKMRSYTFFPKADGNWERVTFGEEGDYYLVFTINARSKAGYDQSLRDYEKLITTYKK